MTDEKTLAPDIPADETGQQQAGSAPDPDNRGPNIDVEAWEKLNKEERRKAWEAMPEEDREKIKETVQRTLEPILEPIKEEVARSISIFTAATQFIQDFFNSEEWKSFRAAWAKLAEDAPELITLANELNDLTPYLEEELKKPQYEGKTIWELLELLYDAEDESEEIESNSLFMQAMTAARAARDEKEVIPAVTINTVEGVDFPLDKINSKVWNLLEADTRGQIKFDVSKRGSGQEIPVYYAINFEELDKDIQITKKLTPTDKRVYIAIGALYNAGNKVITLSQIYKHAGYKGKGGGTDQEKIEKSITKMLGARIYLSNEAEAQKYKKYSKFVYEGPLLPLEIRKAYNVNGAVTDNAIVIFREPPLISFARERKQITTISPTLLQSPVNKTDSNLLIDDYLIERISRAKNGTGKSCRILFKTLYEHAGIKDKPKTNTERQQKKRAPEKIKRYLTHYQNVGFITRFTMEKDGITIYWK